MKECKPNCVAHVKSIMSQSEHWPLPALSLLCVCVYFYRARRRASACDWLDGHLYCGVILITHFLDHGGYPEPSPQERPQARESAGARRAASPPRSRDGSGLRGRWILRPEGRRPSEVRDVAAGARGGRADLARCGGVRSIPCRVLRGAQSVRERWARGSAAAQARSSSCPQACSRGDSILAGGTERGANTERPRTDEDGRAALRSEGTPTKRGTGTRTGEKKTPLTSEPAARSVIPDVPDFVDQYEAIRARSMSGTDCARERGLLIARGMIDWMQMCVATPRPPAEPALRMQGEPTSSPIATGMIPDSLREQATAVLASMVLATTAEVRA